MDGQSAPRAHSFSFPFHAEVAHEDEAPAERAEGGSTLGERAASATGAWSVTRPPENTGPEAPPEPVPQSQVQVLLSGTDTLDLCLYVDFPESYPRIVRKLGQWKRAASGNGGYLAGGRCIVHAGGKPNYPYLLQYPGFILYLSRHARPHGETPNAKLILGSQLLWQRGEVGAYDHAVKELRELTDAVPREVRLSRADITADFLVPGGLTDSFLRHYAVKRSRVMKVYFDNDRMQSFYVGSGQSEIQLRVYDKSAEIMASKKLWFLDLWGLAVNADVWRFEFQLRRPALKSMGLNSLDDWMQSRGTLWKYLTGEWFSLRLPDDENASRRTVHPLWNQVQTCAARFDAADVTIQRQRAIPSCDISHLAKQIAGGVVGLGARCGVIHFEDAKRLVAELLDEEFRVRDYETACQQKAIQLGLESRKDAA